MRRTLFTSLAVTLVGASLLSSSYPVTAQSKSSRRTHAGKAVKHEVQDVMSKPEIAWRFRPQDGEVIGAPAVADGVACVTWINSESATASSGGVSDSQVSGAISLREEHLSGILYGLDARTGRVKWTYALDRAIANPVIANGAVYVSTYHLNKNHGQLMRDREVKNSHVRAIDLQTGRELWRYRIFGNVAPQVAPQENIILFVERESDRYGKRKIYALDAKTGEEKWKRVFTPPRDVYSNVSEVSLLCGGDEKFYVGYEDTLYALNIKTGETQWETKLAASDDTLRLKIEKIRAFDKKIYVTGRVFVKNQPSKERQNLQSVDAQTGRLNFTKDIPLEDSLYFANATGAYFSVFKLLSESPYRGEYSFVALTPDGEREKWRIPLPGGLQLLAGKDLLYMATADYKISARDESGKEIWTYALQDTIDRIAMKDGAIYALSGGTVYALR
jgi:outer membrane protein assembly factor BamB